MKNKLFLFVILFSVQLFGQAQELSLRILDEQARPLPGAAIIVSDASSSTKKTAISDVEGKAQFDLSLKPLKLEVRLLGYVDTVFTVRPSGQKWPELNVRMRSDSEILDEVEVDAMAESQTISGDTTLINAAAFKVTQDASTADLMKKMPGVEINNGTIQVQGESVAKVFVDGKPFFGENSKAALDLIPAEMVKGIKVYDRLSDQARFTGFKDGKTDKTIDIITKKSKRFGVFGKVNAGAGTESAYQTNTQLNLFRGKERISLIVNGDNVNGTGSGLGKFLRRRSWGSNLSNVSKGLAESWNAGLNYNNNWRNGLQIQAGYSYDHSLRNEEVDIFRSYILPSDSGQSYSSRSLTRTEGEFHRFNLDLVWDIDTMNSIEFDPTFNIGQSSVIQSTGSFTDQGATRINQNALSSQSFTKSWDLEGELLYKHRFTKKGRTFSSSFEYENAEDDGSVQLYSTGTFQSRGALTDTIDQNTEDLSRSPVVSAELVYTEPMGGSGLGELRYEASQRLRDNDRKTFDLLASDADLVLDSTLSNVFESKALTQEYSLGYQWEPEEGDWSFSTRLGAQNIILDNDQSLPGLLNDRRTFDALLPYAAIFYEPVSTDFRLRVSYTTATDIPSIGQLQQVVFNSNPLLLSTGNPDLNRSYAHTVSARIIANDPRNSNGFFSYMAFTSNNDFIGTSTQIASENNPVAGLQSGQQITQPVNLSGRWNSRAFGYYGFPMFKGKIKGSLRAGLSYEETPSLINLEKNIANTLSPGLSIGFASNLSDEVDFNINSGMNYGRIRNTLNDAADNEFRTYSTTANFKWQPKWGLSIETDLTYTGNAGLSDGFNVNYTVWNAGIGYRFLESKRLEAKLWIFDILGQNTSINRSFTPTYTEDRRQLVLSRYLMFSLTWQLSKFDPSKMGGGKQQWGRGRGRPPGR